MAFAGMIAEGGAEPWKGDNLSAWLIMIPSMPCHVTPLSAEFTPRGRESTQSLTGLSRGAHGAVQASSSPVPAAAADHKRETRRGSGLPGYCRRSTGIVRRSLLYIPRATRTSWTQVSPVRSRSVLSWGRSGRRQAAQDRPEDDLMTTNPVRDAPLRDSRAKIA